MRAICLLVVALIALQIFFAHAQTDSELADLAAHTYDTSENANALPKGNFRQRAHIAPQEEHRLTNPVANIFTRRNRDGSTDIVVAYRGTEGASDWRTNLVDGTEQKPIPGLPNARGHAGFVDEVNAINNGGLNEQLSNIMRESCGNGKCRVSVTGHSQGFYILLHYFALAI